MTVVATSPDERLWLRWRAERDGQAFEAAVRPHVRFAGDLARRMGLGPDDADEVVQESLVGLALEPRDKPLRVGLRAWLGRSVVSRARMLFRARRRRRAHERAAPPATAPLASGADVREEVEAALGALDDRSRLAVSLRYLHDLEYREVAFVLGTTPLAARLRVHRAVSRLRKRLGGSASAAVASLPFLTTESSPGFVVARATERALAAAPPASVAALGGLLAVTTAAKVSVAVVALAGIAWLAWPSAETVAPSARNDAAEVASQRPTLAAAPHLREVERSGGTSVADVPAPTAAAASATMPALDAPIPPGKGSVFGVLKFQDGTPLRGVKVALWGESPVECVTDDEGRYHLHGDWVAERSLYVKGLRKYDSLGLCSVQMKVDARVESSPVLDRGVEIAATVKAAGTGAPIAGAMVSLRRPHAAGVDMPQAGFGFQTTDDVGRFRFDYVPKAAYTLDVKAAGFEPRLWSFDLANERAPTEFLLAPARWITLRIEGLTDEARKERLAWMIQAPNNPMSPEGRAEIDARGEARIEAPPAGEYTLTLFETDLRPRVEMPLVVTVADLAPIVVRIPASGRCTGTLRDAAGRTVGGAHLSLGSASATTDASGRFTLARAPVGRGALWMFFGSEEDHGKGTLEVAVPEVKAGETLESDIRLPGDAAISGRLDLGEKTEGAVIALMTTGDAPRQVASVRPDARGRFRIPYLAAGTYRFLAMAAERPTVDREIALRDGESLEMPDVAMRPYPRIPVEVVVPSGMSRPSAIQVEWLHASGQHLALGQLTWQSDGRAMLQGILQGTYVLRFMAGGFADVDLTVTVGEGEPTPIRLVLVAK